MAKTPQKITVMPREGQVHIVMELFCDRLVLNPQVARALGKELQVKADEVENKGGSLVVARAVSEAIKGA